MGRDKPVDSGGFASVGSCGTASKATAVLLNKPLDPF